MKKKTKFWLLFFLGFCLFIPLFVLLVAVQAFVTGITLYGVLYGGLSLAGFLMYCFLLYRSVYAGAKPKYPLVPPEGRTDIYFPRTDIPRPIHRDVRQYPDYFKKKKKKTREG